MEIPVIKMDELYGEKRSETLLLLHDACAQWGFFWVSNKAYDYCIYNTSFRSTSSPFSFAMHNTFMSAGEPWNQ
jgi:aminocyclopropanecarboxylate oxidase